jgi:hypothetical protein
MATHNLPFRFPMKYSECSGISSFFLDNPPRDMTVGDDHVIAGVTKSGLESNYFWACNAPRTSTCPLDEIAWFGL